MTTSTSKLLVFAVTGLAACSSACSVDTFASPDPLADAASDQEVMADGGPAIDGNGTGDTSSPSDANGASETGSDVAVDVYTQPYRRVFITSKDYAASFGGLAGGDAICQTVATGASLGGTWAAWLSSTTASAASRLEHASVPYQLLDGTVVASNWAGLVSGTLQNSINRDENNTFVPLQISIAPVSGLVMTGTMGDGTTGTTVFCGGSCTCNDWTATTGSSVLHGQDNETTYYWTTGDGAGTCEIAASLYCIEQ